MESWEHLALAPKKKNAQNIGTHRKNHTIAHRL